MNLFKIAFSNIRKRKSSAITLLVISAVSTLVLSISFSIILNMGSFYDNKRQELNTPDYTIAVLETYWQDSMHAYARNYHDVIETDLSDLYMGEAKYASGKRQGSTQAAFRNDAITYKFNTFSIIDKLNQRPTDSIILPLAFKYNRIKSGDKFSVKSGSLTYDFTVYGFHEDAELGATMTSIDLFYVTPKACDEILNDPNFSVYKCLSLKFNDLATSYDFNTDFRTDYSLSSSNIFSATYEFTKMSATMFALIMALVLILVAIIVTVIALIVVRFSIINNIEEDIKTLGALKSVGFTSRQIVASTLLQFLMIAFGGSVIGVLLAFLAMGYVGNILSSTSGLLWNSAAFFIPALLSVFLLTAIIALITYLVARKSKSITPINALRQGISNHTFKKNTAPLDKTKMPLNISVALKNFVSNLKNNIVTFIIIFLFASLTVLTSTLYYNFVNDTSAFKQMIGFESAELQVSAAGEQFALDKFSEIKNREHVVKTLEFDVFSTTCGGKLVKFYVWEDIAKREASTVVSGRYPKNDNEVAVTSSVIKVLGKKIGDVITVEYEGKTASYLITGITQGIGDTSEYCDMTIGGFSNLKDNIVLKSMFVYLDNSDPAFIDEFRSPLIAEYGKDMNVINWQQAADEQFSSIEGPVAMASYLIAAITIFVICFVFFLMINTIIRRRKKDYGIMKALGFTSRQLILQMLLSFLPIIFAGIFLGALSGFFATNPLLALMFSGAGIAKATFAIPVLFTVTAEILLAGICVLTVYLVSLKTRKISPQKLIVEQ